jgi:L-alanine-DL-glutamate epimerase-like enolase superfamily enzyme
VRIADLHLHRLDIPFREAFRHSAAERAATETLWVTARTAAGFHGNGEGCPRRYVTGEDSTSALAFFREHRASLVSEVDGLASLTGWIASHRDAIDRNPATFCAVELAILDALAREGGASVEELLGHRPLPRAFEYSAVLGVSSPTSFAVTLDRYARLGFADYKLKTNGDLQQDRARVEAVRDRVPQARIRIDANNFWHDPRAAAAHVRALPGPILAVEEPLEQGDMEGAARFAAETVCRSFSTRACCSRGRWTRWPLRVAPGSSTSASRSSAA